MVWYSHLFKNFPQFVVIHPVKGFSLVNEAEVDVFLEFPGFFCDSNGKESASNVGDPGFIPGWEDPLEKGRATHSSILPREFHGQRSLGSYSPLGHKELDMTELSLAFSMIQQMLAI